MVTIKVNERSKAGKALLEIARIFSMDKDGVEIVEPDAKSETTEKVPNDTTLKTFEKTDKEKDLIKTENHKDLMDKLFS